MSFEQRKRYRLSKRAISKTQVNYKLHYSALSFDPIVSWKKSAFNTNQCHFSHTAPTQWRCLFHADSSMILVPNRMYSSEMFSMSPTATLFLEMEDQKKNKNYLSVSDTISTHVCRSLYSICCLFELIMDDTVCVCARAAADIAFNHWLFTFQHFQHLII